MKCRYIGNLWELAQTRRSYAGEAELAGFTCKWEGAEYLSRLLSSKLVIRARIKPLDLKIPPYASSFYRDKVGNTLDTRIGSGDGDPSGLLIHLDGPLKQADVSKLYLLRLYTVKCRRWMISSCCSSGKKVPWEDQCTVGWEQDTWRDLCLHHTFHGSLAGPPRDGPTGCYRVGSQATEPSFFDGIGMQKVELV
ncbi:hypothetical protein PG993_010579 [Apiospora rasikravindrae]|uniref:Uncharacterized protein n=1 Tax=Apiospora rasikravindrae TaxID=990691 RepID=A0ABR1SPE5_9PEZI